MKFLIILIILFFSPLIKAACGIDGCKTIKGFTDSYVKALLSQDKKELKDHYHSNKYTCFLDRFKFDGVYTGHDISYKKELKGESLDHFLLTYKSEATKIKLFNDFRAKSHDLSDSEIFELVFKELQKPDLERVNLPMDVMPTQEVRLNINGKLYRQGHPCFRYTGTSNYLHLVNTISGYKAIEPMCDVGRAVGSQIINRDNYNDNIKLTTPQLNEIKKHITKQKHFSRLRTRTFIMENYGYNSHKAKYAVKQVCDKL